MRRAARRDVNEPSLISTAKQFGAQCVLAGPLDWWIGFRGQWVPLEIKHGTNPYTAVQVRFLEHCRIHSLPVWTWRTDLDVFESLGAHQTA